MRAQSSFEEYLLEEDEYLLRPKYGFALPHLFTAEVEHSTLAWFESFFLLRVPIALSSLQSSSSKTERQFTELASKWKKETRGMSTSFHMTINDNYLDIIAMGPVVIPFILKELERRPDHWFVALRHLARPENPVPKEHLGNLSQMAKDWVDWGRRKGII